MKIPSPVFLFSAALISASPAATVTVTDALFPADAGNLHYGHDGITNKVSFMMPSGGHLSGAIPTQYMVGYFTGYTDAMAQELYDPSTVFQRVNDSSQFVPIGRGEEGLGADVYDRLEVNAHNRVANAIPEVLYLNRQSNPVSGGLPRRSRLFLLMVANQEDMVYRQESTLWWLVSASSWTVPETGGTNMILRLKDVDTMDEVFHGTLGPLARNIPEPQTALLALLSVTGLLVRRRRVVIAG